MKWKLSRVLKRKPRGGRRSSSCSQVRKARGVARRVVSGKGKLLLLTAWLGAGKRGGKGERGVGDSVDLAAGSWQPLDNAQVFRWHV